MVTGMDTETATWCWRPGVCVITQSMLLSVCGRCLHVVCPSVRRSSPSVTDRDILISSPDRRRPTCNHGSNIPDSESRYWLAAALIRSVRRATRGMRGDNQQRKIEREGDDGAATGERLHWVIDVSANRSSGGRAHVTWQCYHYNLKSHRRCNNVSRIRTYLDTLGHVTILS